MKDLISTKFPVSFQVQMQLDFYDSIVKILQRKFYSRGHLLTF